MSGRIRSIKPEWLEDEALAMSSSDARVLSVALLLLADDYGNGRANDVQLCGAVFPAKIRDTPEKALDGVSRALEELVMARFVVLYEVDGQHYFHIRTWDRHQKVDKPGRPRVPEFSAEFASVAKVREDVSNARVKLATDQDHDHDQDHDQYSSSSPLDAGVLEQPVEFVAGKPSIATEARRVFEAWKLDTGHARSTLDRKRQARIEARLREGFSADELILAITHRRNDPWLMGTAEGSPRVFDGIETLLRDAAQVEKLRDLNKPLQSVRRGSGPVQKDRENNPFFSIEKLRSDGAIVDSSTISEEPLDEIGF